MATWTTATFFWLLLIVYNIKKRKYPGRVGCCVCVCVFLGGGGGGGPEHKAFFLNWKEWWNVRSVTPHTRFFFLLLFYLLNGNRFTRISCAPLDKDESTVAQRPEYPVDKCSPTSHMCELISLTCSHAMPGVLCGTPKGSIQCYQLGDKGGIGVQHYTMCFAWNT